MLEARRNYFISGAFGAVDFLDRLPSCGTVEYQFGGVRLSVAFDEHVHENQNYSRRLCHRA